MYEAKERNFNKQEMENSLTYDLIGGYIICGFNVRFYWTY